MKTILRFSKCTISFVLVLFTNIIEQFSFKQAFMSKTLSNSMLLAQFLKFFSLCHTEIKTHSPSLLHQLLIWLLILEIKSLCYRATPQTGIQRIEQRLCSIYGRVPIGEFKNKIEKILKPYCSGP